VSMAVRRKGSRRTREAGLPPHSVHRAEQDLPPVAQPPYRTRLGRAEVSQAVKAAFKDEERKGRDGLVLEHLPLVKAIAVRIHENVPVHVDIGDLVHAGILGLFEAVDKYKPEKKVAFSSYAKHRIKNSILDSLRQLDWASRDLRRRHKQVEVVTRDLAATLQRQPTEAEIAEKLDMGAGRWRDMMIDLEHVGLVSASSRPQDTEELPARPETHPERMYAQAQLRTLLEDALKTLPPRYQKVVSLYYLNDMTMREVGAILGITESRVSRIHNSALGKLALAATLAPQER